MQNEDDQQAAHCEKKEPLDARVEATRDNWPEKTEEHMSLVAHTATILKAIRDAKMSFETYIVAVVSEAELKRQKTNYVSPCRRCSGPLRHPLGNRTRIGPTRRRDETGKDRGNLRSRGVVVRCSRAREERRTDGAARTQNGGCSDRIIATGEAEATGGDRPEGGKIQRRRIDLTITGRLGRREEVLGFGCPAPN
ncbi:hypothetical protein NDU88_001496 [Pleurodeles waltl]|uniref:Uncharacterized protein n=1 Tax=Pleurodeles waltl TaxID=8319 RepID=A0AAV7TKA2_PLEWA|nr:hypothetical protein NDU88_001496 [Pleurodeles waltl]